MKKLISICFLSFFVVIGNAQLNTKPQLNELSQDQLNLALTKSKVTIKTGRILTFTGVGVSCLGIVIGAGSVAADIGTLKLDDNSGKGGAIIMCLGGGITLIGIPVWIVGASKKHKITMNLEKFNPSGSASINGIGLKMRF